MLRSVRPHLLALLLALAPGLGASVPDAGIELSLDRASYELRVRDLRSGDEGPRLRVALGSPAHPTPRGAFPLGQVVLNPAWVPGPRARAAGAQPEPPSTETPMGVGKIPFAAGGLYALHGGALPVLLGKPVSGGCIRTRDADLLRLVAWLQSRGALSEPAPSPAGEVSLRFLRAARLLAP